MHGNWYVMLHESVVILRAVAYRNKSVIRAACNECRRGVGCYLALIAVKVNKILRRILAYKTLACREVCEVSIEGNDRVEQNLEVWAQLRRRIVCCRSLQVQKQQVATLQKE